MARQAKNTNLSAEASTDKRAKFKELAEKRLDNALGKIKLLGNLGNKAQYEYNEDDVKVIATELANAVNAVVAKLQGKSKAGGGASRFK